MRVSVDTAIIRCGSRQDVSPISVRIDSGKTTLRTADWRGSGSGNAETKKDVAFAVRSKGRVYEDAGIISSGVGEIVRQGGIKHLVNRRPVSHGIGVIYIIDRPAATGARATDHE